MKLNELCTLRRYHGKDPANVREVVGIATRGVYVWVDYVKVPGTLVSSCSLRSFARWAKGKVAEEMAKPEDELTQYIRMLATECPIGWTLTRHDQSRVVFQHADGRTMCWGEPRGKPIGVDRVNDLRIAIAHLKLLLESRR